MRCVYFICELMLVWTECTCNVGSVYFICECGQSVLVM